MQLQEKRNNDRKFKKKKKSIIGSIYGDSSQKDIEVEQRIKTGSKNTNGHMELNKILRASSLDGKSSNRSKRYSHRR